MRPNRRQTRAISPTPSADSKVDELDDSEELSDNELNPEDSDDLGDLQDNPQDDDEVDLDPSDDDNLSQSDSDLEDDNDEEEEEDEEEESSDEQTTRTTRRSSKRRNNDDSDDDLDNDGEVVSNRALTKRQRAKLNNIPTEEFLELPIVESAKKKHLTQEEQALRRSEVARRRKNQSIQRAEKDKEDTINRLLKKQASKSRRVIKEDTTDDKVSPAKRRMAMLRDPNSLHYVSSREGTSVSIPSNLTVEQVYHSERNAPREPVYCQVEECKQLKKYTAKKSGKAVCSLEHYKLVEA